MGHDVTSYFEERAESYNSEPIRKFILDGVDYSDFVTQWPKFKQTWDSIRPSTLSVKLTNADETFTELRNDLTITTKESTFEMGFKGTNLLKYSEQFDTAPWIKERSIVSQNSTLSPINNLTADKIERVSAGNNFIFQTFFTSSSSNKSYTFSCWLKKGVFFDGNDDIRLFIKDGSFGDLVAISAVLTNEWVRFSVSGTFGSSPADNVAVIIDPINDTGSPGDYFYAWGAQLVEGLEAGSYKPTTDTAHIEDELITLYSGRVERLAYNNNSVNITFVDKFKQLTERVIGTRTENVSFVSSNYLPADIAWSIITSYGGYDATPSSANVDIDYESWLTWSNIFSSDAVYINANFQGIKVSEGLKKIAQYTDSAIFVHDNKISFRRFSLTDSNQTIFDNDSILDLSLAIDNRDIVNKMYVSGLYDVNSKEWAMTVNDENSPSVSSLGLKEDTIRDSSIWYINSGSALNLAQRKVNALKNPFDKISLDTTLKGIHRIIGETISVVDLSVNVAGGYRIMSQSINMDKGTVMFDIDRSYFSDGFILDTTSLNGTEILT